MQRNAIDSAPSGHGGVVSVAMDYGKTMYVRHDANSIDAPIILLDLLRLLGRVPTSPS